MKENKTINAPSKRRQQMEVKDNSGEKTQKNVRKCEMVFKEDKPRKLIGETG